LLTRVPGVHLDKQNRPGLGDRSQRRDSERRGESIGGIPKSLAEALVADRSGEIESAAVAYENVLAAGDRSQHVLLNLALLYWQATDPGLAADKRLGHDFFSRAGRCFPELLDEAEQRFPNSTAARFWRRYIA